MLPENELLSWFKGAAALSSEVQLVRLAAGQPLFSPGDPIGMVWFPATALIGLMVTGEDGSAVGVGLVGRDGALGLMECLGGARAFATARVLLGGEAWRAPAELVRLAFGADPDTFRLICRYEAGVQAEIQRALLCQATHQGAGRLAHVLLLCADYAGSEEALLTHESLAALVGLQRTTVTTLLGEMVQQGLIRGGRGRVRLLDRSRLEHIACPCRRPRTRQAARPAVRMAEAVHG